MTIQASARHIAMCLNLLIISTSLAAQSKRGGPPPQKLPSSTQVSEMVIDITQTLSLSKSQATKISALYEDHFQDARGRMQAGKKAHDKNRLVMDKLRLKFEAEVKSMLSAKQAKAYSDFLKSHRPPDHKQRSRK